MRPEDHAWQVGDRPYLLWGFPKPKVVQGEILALPEDAGGPDTMYAVRFGEDEFFLDGFRMYPDKKTALDQLRRGRVLERMIDEGEV